MQLIGGTILENEGEGQISGIFLSRQQQIDTLICIYRG